MKLTIYGDIDINKALDKLSSNLDIRYFSSKSIDIIAMSAIVNSDIVIIKSNKMKEIHSFLMLAISTGCGPRLMHKYIIIYIEGKFNNEKEKEDLEEFVSMMFKDVCININAQMGYHTLKIFFQENKMYGFVNEINNSCLN